MESGSGFYPIERRPGEIQRLRAQAAAIAFDAGLMLERIGVAPGWVCLDVGCGAGGILELLGARAGSTGRVVGLDADPMMLAAARDWTRAHGLGNVALVASDAYRPALRASAFDLVHVRFLASTVGRADDLIRQALALVKPGGVLAFQEPDTETLTCHPGHPAWDRLKRALQAAFESTGGDTRIGQRLYRLLRAAGLEAVAYRPFLVGVISGGPMTDYLPATAESIRSTLLGKGLIGERELDEVLAACRRHLADPDTVFTTFLVVQAWGRRPAGSGA
ncbi:MAG: methyltransferase domain-containing protein [Candidatus Rokuibacteriota bacterium]